ncbi:DUF4416 family protein [Thermodesulfatator autotrophicus]|uniref:GTP-binding protein n=1 Tax=Thermodesulfatator autotrophicus TaxID=1795632 RepID=A0A177E8V5_9BACT|nr:DUF4416 family protein [Thermodesulfatator autotrophicus]OAG27840.1 hypothetical protein TH606_04730 [Thermodesulfatator autotrophicus]
MSSPQKPALAQLFFSIFARDEVLIDEVSQKLADILGPIDFKSPLLPFDWTDYYEKEFGKGLVRRFIFFKELIPQERIVPIKHLAWKLEKSFSKNGNRLVNIDPGYLLLEKLVLVTFKNFSHRLYLGDYVYGEVTMIYTKGDFVSLPWTYPDYASENVKALFREARKRYREKLKLCL